MDRILVIGDIHGGLRALNQIFERASVSKDDMLIFLGDYVDGWSESAQVVEYLIELKQQWSCIFLKGNHDLWCEEWLRSGTVDPNWYYHGGESALKSYDDYDSEAKKKHLEFFEDTLFYFVDPFNRLFIHAGFTSPRGPQYESPLASCCWDRTLWDTTLSIAMGTKKDSNLYWKRLNLFKEIYLGHTPTINYGEDAPMHAINVWNIDTGSAFSGKLTLMDVDTKQFWQSDTVKDLYPGEKGRNK
jgi:serine/threonine protein phosphatase 1